MRKKDTYRAERRNHPGNFVRVSGENWRRPFSAEIKTKPVPDFRSNSRDRRKDLVTVVEE